MKVWLSTKGALAACFTVYSDFFAYRSGVYRHVTGGLAGGHCVSIVGYDDAAGCWIAKNSWGAGWGDMGFFRIAYGQCGIDATMWGVTVAPPPGRRVPLYRYWNPGIADHFYTTNWSELGAGRYGWNYEGIQCYVLAAQVAGTVPLYRYWNSSIGDHFYTTSWSELGAGRYGWRYEGIQCYVAASRLAGTVPLYRYWNSRAGDHFYTTNWSELGSGRYGWVLEGIQCYVYSSASAASEGTSAEGETVPETFRAGGDQGPELTVGSASGGGEVIDASFTTLESEPPGSFAVAGSSSTSGETDVPASFSTSVDGTVRGPGEMEISIRIRK
jgi:Papain family cysteine protease/Repeat of unknown function (DUF5648)